MIDIANIKRICSWDNVDFVCIKSDSKTVNLATYYLEGHQKLESFLTDDDNDLIRFANNLGCYSTAEIMLSEKNSNQDRFYIRITPSTELQESQLYIFLTQKLERVNKNANSLFEIYKLTEQFTGEFNDYKPLYFCGFIKHRNSNLYDKVRFYFKTFGVDEQRRNDLEIIHYLENWTLICEDCGFKTVRDLILGGQVGLRSIGFELDNTGNFNLKFYLCRVLGEFQIEELIETLQSYPVFKSQANKLLPLFNELNGYYCELIQLSSGSATTDAHINLYLRPNKRESRMYYSLNRGLVLRNIGGVTFLIDIHEKNYYDSKSIFSVNQTGKAIIEYFKNNNIGTVEGAVSYLKSLLIDYTSDLYPILFADCTAFILTLLDKGYLKEEK